MSRDYSRHIAENIAKGSSLCPFGSLTMGQAAWPETAADDDDVEAGSGDYRKLDLHGFDADAPDSDDEPLSDLEW
jgi:hypothetical protein